MSNPQAIADAIEELIDRKVAVAEHGWSPHDVRPGCSHESMEKAKRELVNALTTRWEDMTHEQRSRKMDGRHIRS